MPDEALEHFRQAVPRGEELVRRVAATTPTQYDAAHPEKWAALRGARWPASCPRAGTPTCPRFEAGEDMRHPQGVGTRCSSGRPRRCPQLVGRLGRPRALDDHATSTDAGSVETGAYDGRNLHFGIREHAMGAIVQRHGAARCFRAYGATFLIFSDYMRPPIRLAALMELPSIFVFTHDSIGLGEDGPTHQPVEQLAHLRAIPNLHVVRPADANETALGVALRDPHRHRPDGARALAPGPADHRPGEGARRRDRARRLRAARTPRAASPT